jgi:hypothetical protein
MNRYGSPFPRNAQVVDELRDDKMIQPAAPLPYREAELDFLQKALEIKGHGLL